MRIRYFFLATLCLLQLSLIPTYGSTTKRLLPLPTDSKVTSKPKNPDHFTFVVTGDNRAAGKNLPMPPTLDRICTEIGLLRPAFTLWTGDAIYGADDTVAEANAEYDEFLKTASKTQGPIYNAPGNHEISDRVDLEQLYKQRMGPLYGSFDFGNSHFIALNTEEMNLGGGIGKDQFTWLQQDLDTNARSAHIFVFMHHPLFPKPGEKEGWQDATMRDAVHRLFVSHKVSAVFSGHEHLYYHSNHDGVEYYISGGAGAPTDASPEDGGYQHYMLLEVDGSKFSATIMQPWRLFAAPSNANTGATQISNYNNNDVEVSLAIAVSGNKAGLTAEAVSTYKGKSKRIDAVIVNSDLSRTGSVIVKVKVPAHRSAVVSVTAAR